MKRKIRAFTFIFLSFAFALAISNLWALPSCVFLHNWCQRDCGGNPIHIYDSNGGCAIQCANPTNPFCQEGPWDCTCTSY